MPTTRGFVEALGVGRAGLVQATVVHDDGATMDYTLSDLDADPERFNERLSKFGILRDAMDRAEPVEIEFDETDGSVRPIDAVKRLTRDALQGPRQTTTASGSVVGLAIALEVGAGPRGEAVDTASFSLLTDSGPSSFRIALQMPERATAEAMVDTVREAQASGAPLVITYDVEGRWVSQVTRSDQFNVDESNAEQFSAFVEEITHAPFSNLMLVAVTTAPEFQEIGNIVPLVDFTPEARRLVVFYGSPEYALLEAALRDKLRVELFALRRGRPTEEAGRPEPDSTTTESSLPVNEQPIGVAVASSTERAVAASSLPADAYLLRGATLQHALCSASRPVWIEVNRRALDVGPDDECVEGLPTNDMRPRTMRELNLPYRAKWIGHGCFNHGVYRIQLKTDRDITVLVDGEEICLHLSKDGGAKFGHACLDGDHEVCVAFENWRCEAEFDIDVFRLR